MSDPEFLGPASPPIKMTASRYRRLLPTVVLVMCAAIVRLAVLPSSAWAQPDDEVPMELKPYRIQVLVAFSEDTVFTTGFRQRTLTRLGERCESFWGRMCHVEIRENRHLYPATVATLKRVAAADIPTDKQGFDKTFVLVLQSVGGGYRVAGKVWEATTREMSELVTTDLYHRDEAAGHLFGLLSELFEPIVAIGKFERETVWLTVRAGEILPSDPSQAQLPPGRLLRPFYRFLSREQEILRIQSIPWTYFVVTESDRAQATCRLVSGLRVPLTTRRRRLIQALAVGIQPRFSGTRLKLESQHVPDQPLTGFTVHLISPEENIEPISLLSGRDGSVLIPSTEGEYPIILAVRSGRALLAKLPFIPGLVQETTIPLPDDSARLKVEGELSVLEAEIIDAVADRAVLMSRARLTAKNNEWKQVDEKLVKINELPGIGHYQTQLTIIRERGVDAAEARRDRAAKRRIERLCEQTGGLIDRYLKLDKIREFKEEIAELREDLTSEEK